MNVQMIVHKLVQNFEWYSWINLKACIKNGDVKFFGDQQSTFLEEFKQKIAIFI